jgi:hypothetical protein
VVIDDLRLEYSPLLGRNWSMSGWQDVDFPNGGGTSTHANTPTTQTVRSHRRYGLGYYRSLSPLQAEHGSFIFGVAPGYDRTETLGGSYGRAWMVDGFAGFAWAFTPAWHIEEGVILGGGRVHWRVHTHQFYFDNTDWYADDTAFIYEYGVRLGTSYTWNYHLQAALDLRYLASDTRLLLDGSHTSGGTTETVSYRPRVHTEGLGGLLAVGWRF